LIDIEKKKPAITLSG